MSNLAQVIPMKIRQVGFWSDRQVLARLHHWGKTDYQTEKTGERNKRREGSYREQ